MISNHFYENKKNLKRNIAKVRALGSRPPSNPILHFEAYSDMQLVENFVEENQSRLTAFGNLSNSLLYNFTVKKTDAIKLHKQALDINMNITTLVDMDYDINQENLIKVQGLDEIITRVHSTFPSCALETYVFYDDAKLDDQRLINFLRSFEQLKEASEEELSSIKDIAIEKTWKRLMSGYYMNHNNNRSDKKPVYLKKVFKEKKIRYPLNDHSLVETLMEKIYGYDNVELNYNKVKSLSDKQKREKNGIEQKLKHFFLKQPEKVLVLLSPLFEELNESYLVD